MKKLSKILSFFVLGDFSSEGGRKDLQWFRESIMISFLLLHKSRNLGVNIYVRMCGSKEHGLKVYLCRVFFHPKDPGGISTTTNTNFTGWV